MPRTRISQPGSEPTGTDALARVLVAIGVTAALAGVAFLMWRWSTPSECAWMSPSTGDWLVAGVRPAVTAECGLPSGATVTGAEVLATTVELERGASDPVVLALQRSGPLVLDRLIAAASSLVFCAGLFALSLYGSLRRRTDRTAATTVVLSGALLGSTIATMVGLPPHNAFAGPPRWAFMTLTAPVFLLAWGASLAWLLEFPSPLFVTRRPGVVRAAALLGPVALWAAIVAPLWVVSEGFTGWMRASIVVQSSLTVTAVAASLAALVVHLRRVLGANPGSVPRQQLLWVAGSAAVSALLALSLWLLPQLLTGEALLPDEAIGAPGLIFVLGFGVALTRYRMFDLDPWLARTLVYAGLTLAAVLVYLITTAVLAAGIGNLAPGQSAAVGAVVAALAVNPLRVRLDRWVNRTIYGDRDDPYAALSRVATEVANQGVADRRTADDIRRALRAPYVRIAGSQDLTLESGDQRALAAGAVEIPLEHAGVSVGVLEVAVRGAGERYGPAERRLLADIARQIGIGLREQQLVAELQKSREGIVTAREEERRALRRALHDDAGPAMASVSLRAETVRRHLARGSGGIEQAQTSLQSISSDASATAESLRRLAYDLRPPALDEHGLAEALSRFAAGVTVLPVTVSADLGPDAESPSLSAAVEAALYRIAVAAVDNSVRHSHAQRCTVTVERSADTVELTVTDDGSGFPPGTARGVGITSMMERAAELGGRVTVANGKRGTVVRAEIPVGRP